MLPGLDIWSTFGESTCHHQSTKVRKLNMPAMNVVHSKLTSKHSIQASITRRTMNLYYAMYTVLASCICSLASFSGRKQPPNNPLSSITQTSHHRNAEKSIVAAVSA